MGRQMPDLSDMAGQRVLRPWLGSEGEETAAHNLVVWSFLGGGRSLLCSGSALNTPPPPRTLSPVSPKSFLGPMTGQEKADCALCLALVSGGSSAPSLYSVLFTGLCVSVCISLSFSLPIFLRVSPSVFVSFCVSGLSPHLCLFVCLSLSPYVSPSFFLSLCVSGALPWRFPRLPFR